MKRTGPAPLIGLFLIGGVASYLLELVVQSRGGFIYVPPISLAFTLFVVAAAVVFLAVPIRRKVTGKRKEPIDAFYAARVLALAKASSFAGSLLLGLGAGVLLYLLGRHCTQWCNSDQCHRTVGLGCTVDCCRPHRRMALCASSGRPR